MHNEPKECLHERFYPTRVKFSPGFCWNNDWRFRLCNKCSKTNQDSIRYMGLLKFPACIAVNYHTSHTLGRPGNTLSSDGTLCSRRMNILVPVRQRNNLFNEINREKSLTSTLSIKRVG